MLFTLILACAKQTMVLSPQPVDPVPIVQTSQFFIGGIAQEDMISAERVCPKGVGKVTTSKSGKDVGWWVGLSFIGSSWIYTPRTWEIYCIK